MHILAAYGLKSSRSCGDGIVSDLQWRKNEDAAAIGSALQSQAGIGVGGIDLGVGNYRAGGVLHNAGDGALIGLG